MMEGVSLVEVTGHSSMPGDVIVLSADPSSPEPLALALSSHGSSTSLHSTLPAHTHKGAHVVYELSHEMKLSINRFRC